MGDAVTCDPFGCSHALLNSAIPSSAVTQAPVHIGTLVFEAACRRFVSQYKPDTGV